MINVYNQKKTDQFELHKTMLFHLGFRENQCLFIADDVDG